MNSATVYLVVALLFCDQAAVFGRQGGPCEYSDDFNPQQWSECIYGGYSIPGNLDPQAIHPNVTRLTVTGRTMYGMSHLNVVHANFTAFPSRPALRDVEFSHFNEAQDQIRFPLNDLLVNNKHRIDVISLSQVKMLHLTEADFMGFPKLRSLKLVDTFLVTISPSVFNGLGYLSSGIQMANYTPKLGYLTIEGHPDLKSLDWSFLQPLSNSLEGIYLSFDSLSSSQLTLSSPFQLNQLSEVSVKKSPYFSVFPDIIYNSINASQPSRYLSITLENLPLCPIEEDCSCCEMQPFVNWLKQNLQGPALRRIQCGPVAQCRCGATLTPTKSSTDGIMLLANHFLHDHCSNGSQRTPSDTPLKKNQPFMTICVRGVMTRSVDDIDGIIAHQAEYDGDITSNCSDAGNSLYKWILEKSGLAVRYAFESGSVTAICTGKGDISVRAISSDTASSGKVAVKVESTKKCLDFFFEFVAKLMAL